MTAGAFALALVGSATVGFLKVPGNFRVVPMGLLLVDAMLLLALSLVAIRANRWWLIPVAGCQLVAVLVHTGKMLDPAMIPNGYAFLVKVWSWPMVALLAYGTWAHRSRIRRGIMLPDWKLSSMQQRFPIRRAL
ncbi:MAG: hypothetical protein HOP91_05395 [Sphingomonas sp.]|nr:hypothetical protein [Sphingomonas sp.]